MKQAYTDLIEGRIQKVKEEYRVINHADGHKHFDWVEAQAAVETYDENNKPLTWWALRWLSPNGKDGDGTGFRQEPCGRVE